MRLAIIGCALSVLLIFNPREIRAGGENDSAAGTATDSSEGATVSAASKSTEATETAAGITSEIEELKHLLQQQATQIEEQRAVNQARQKRLEALESELASMRTASPSPSPSASRPPAAPAAGTSTAAVAKQPAADGDTSPLYFKIGRANFAPGGFLDMTTVVRSKTVGSGLPTAFGAIPYAVAANYPAAGLTELRMSAQNTRASLKVDSHVGGATVFGYLEADLLGNNATTMYVTSNSATLRLRMAIADVSIGKWEFLSGQAWTLLTPNRKGLSPMPSDIFYALDADSNYQMGIVWGRQAQVRVVYHANPSWALGFSVENPQQFLGSAVTVPTNFASAQADTNGASWGANTNTPNLHPDLISKVAYDRTFAGRSFHMDAAGIYRTFKINTFVAASGSTPQINGNSLASGGGVSFNTNLELFKNFHVIENAYWSAGGGRYILGLAPDVVIRPANAAGLYTISPVQAGSGLAGFEWQVFPRIMFYGYYSALYVDRDFFRVASNTSCGAAGYCGYGFPGSSSTNNRTIEEASFGVTRTIWSSPEIGKFVVHIQAAYVQRNPWAAAAGTPDNANLVMGYVTLKYVLP